MTFAAFSNCSEFRPHWFSTDASDLGLRPGQWPEFIRTELGNKHTLVRWTKKLDEEGELLWVTYRQSVGCVLLRIYND